MKKKLSIVLAITLTLILSLATVAFAAGGQVATPNPDVALAKQAGENFITEVGVQTQPQWEGADLLNSTVYHDLQGNLISYMFSINKDNEVLGRMMVGNSLYNYSVLEAGTAMPPSIPSESEVKLALARDLSLAADDLSKPMLVYLGYGRYYAIYEISRQSVGFDLLSKHVYVTAELRSSLATPEQYKQYYKDRPAKGVGLAPLYANPLPVPLRGMNDPRLPDEYRNNNNCGPTSGAMLSAYWKTWCPNFLNWPQDHNRLYVKMHCNSWGGPGVAPWNCGPGWVDYASERGYNNFDTDWGLNKSYNFIQWEIYCGRPMMVMFSWHSGYIDWHWCALKGYESNGTDWIIINDPQGSQGHEVYLDWGAIAWDTVITRIYQTS